MRSPLWKFSVGASGFPSTSRPRRISQLMCDGDSATKYPSGIVAVVARGDDEVLAALAPVGTGPAHVDDEPEPGVVDRARSAAGRDLDDGRAVAVEVEDAGRVDGVGVAGEEQRVRVQQVVDDRDLVAGRRPRASSIPMRIASRDAAGTQLRNTSTPRRKSRWS